ncbi:MAG: NUDIX domain-containing protein [Candidatus Parcubacteria bacterium]|nr:NUDIX domain-containing protein [Candidatus Parcubacteria bacterium]
MKIATLGIVLQNGTVLLGEKKKGEIGTGVLSGPGGKLDPGETLPECLVRETREELKIELDPASLELVAIIDFYAAGEIDFCVYVYRTETFFGELEETADMIPAWYPLDNLPYDRMFDSDRHWFARAACGEKFRANVYYRERAKDFDRIEFLPFDG